jgi:hypothetical protein
MTVVPHKGGKKKKGIIIKAGYENRLAFALKKKFDQVKKEMD